MKHAALLFFLISLFLSSQTFAWTWRADFECGIVGQQIEMASGCGILNKKLSKGASLPRIGNISLEVGITEGTTDNNEFGGKVIFGDSSINNGGNLVEGKQVWYRVYYFFPSDFDFTAGGSGLKIARLHTVDSSGSHEGYMTIHIQGNLSIGNGIDRDGFKQNNGGEDKYGKTFAKGRWVAIEHYVKLSSTPGHGIYRVWQDGDLVFEDKLTITLGASNSKANEILLFTYWNNGAPKTQQAYIDEIIVTSDVPNNTDNAGNNFIGTGDVVILAAPKPPTNIIVNLK